MARYFKIRDKETGLFSGGGSMPNFTKNGKMWTDRRALSAHLTWWVGKWVPHFETEIEKQDRKTAKLSKYEIVEYEVKEITVIDADKY